LMFMMTPDHDPELVIFFGWFCACAGTRAAAPKRASAQNKGYSDELQGFMGQLILS
jgi:hypothetical protein